MEGLLEEDWWEGSGGTEDGAGGGGGGMCMPGVASKVGSMSPASSCDREDCVDCSCSCWRAGGARHWTARRL